MYMESTRVWGSLHGGMCARDSMRGRSGGGSDRKWTGASWREEVDSGEGWLFIETAEGGRKFIRAAIFLRDGRLTAACWRLRVHPSIQSDSVRGKLALERNFLKSESGPMADETLTKLRRLPKSSISTSPSIQLNVPSPSDPQLQPHSPLPPHYSLCQAHTSSHHCVASAVIFLPCAVLDTSRFIASARPFFRGQRPAAGGVPYLGTHLSFAKVTTWDDETRRAQRVDLPEIHAGYLLGPSAPENTLSPCQNVIFFLCGGVEKDRGLMGCHPCRVRGHATMTSLSIHIPAGRLPPSPVPYAIQCCARHSMSHNILFITVLQ
ncbi:hypothetical protein ARMGADRAFT_814500 [Armillaria gallica]|uniref:Uncharacterized protein n=1 Tax=Armillaria gallica TaxID=47427 RepID=A0A2H3CH22_ARMGA|nr:hypothetical protein ARMGADRAFT_814500 [Armillaria gallica]